MKLKHLILPTSALGVAFSLALPTPVRGFTVFGDTLDVTQRDFRIWNNFTDLQANDNQAHDPDFPGATGATLAIWKGVAEWGSAPHGHGTTDPSQDVIGSGGSNFDAFFSGHSGGPGNKNANVISQLDGTSFIKAFTEIPIRDGWRIRYYEDPWVWNDGPDTVLLGGIDAMDIQGVAAHEYGHALGLDHSFDTTATMHATGTPGAVELRSIEADDIAGLQFLYGVRSPDKPLIEGYELLPMGQVLIKGRGFHPTDNQVWFTHRAELTGPDGDPVRVKGLASTDGGARLLVTIPIGAGAGDILVKVPGVRSKDLSNAFPFDPLHEHLPLPLAYGTGKTTSTGSTPLLELLTLPSASAGTFRLKVTGATDGTAIVLSGAHRQQAPFQGGELLITTPVEREAVFQLFFGTASVDVPVPAELIGVTRYYQVWFEDAGDAFGSGLTNAIQLTYLP